MVSLIRRDRKHVELSEDTWLGLTQAKYLLKAKSYDETIKRLLK